MTNDRSVSPDETSYATMLTPRGRGAVATVRFDGDCRQIDAAGLFRAANGRPLSLQTIDRIVFGHWGCLVPEEVVLCRTSHNALAIHCHGGDAAVSRILDDLQHIGCSISSWQETTRRTLGLFDAELLEKLTQATTSRTVGILLTQQSGRLREALEELLNEEQFATAPGRGDLENRLDELLEWSEFGLHLTRPWTVVLAGRPNVGKSSLINTLVGYTRAIVHELPGTTRDIVTAEVAIDGWPVLFSDTAGIRSTSQELEAAGIERARRQLDTADCRVLLLDTSRPPHAGDVQLLADWPDAIRVAHKSDLPNVWGTQMPAAALPVSSVTGDGVETLTATLIARLVPRIPAAETPLPICERQITLLRAALDAIHQADHCAWQDALRDCLS